MIDEANRQHYLSNMGVTQWQLRDQPVQQSAPQEIIHSDTTLTAPSEINQLGISWLNKGSKNGLLVLLPEERKELSNEGRKLMSNMLNSIHFIPSETGFAIIGESQRTAEALFHLNAIKAILVFGGDAGKSLVSIAGARVIPGSEVFSLEGCKAVITVHPEDILSHPENKKQAWVDLKQLVQLFNQS